MVNVSQSPWGLVALKNYGKGDLAGGAMTSCERTCTLFEGSHSAVNKNYSLLSIRPVTKFPPALLC